MSDTGAIGGRVTNQQDNSPLGDVSLGLNGEGSDQSGSSGADGSYEFSDLQPGQYDLTASNEGFEDEGFGPLVVVADVTTTIDICMQPPPAQPDADVAARIAEETNAHAESGDAEAG